MILSWFRQVLKGPRSLRPTGQRLGASESSHWRPRCEALEDRWLPSGLPTSLPSVVGTGATPPRQSVTANRGDGTLDVIQNEAFTAVVASFAPVAPLPTLSAQIDWGDNSHSAGIPLAKLNGGIDVVGSHTYPNVGTFSLTVTLRCSGDGRSSPAGSDVEAEATRSVVVLPEPGDPASGVPKPSPPAGRAPAPRGSGPLAEPVSAFPPTPATQPEGQAASESLLPRLPPTPMDGTGHVPWRRLPEPIASPLSALAPDLSDLWEQGNRPALGDILQLSVPPPADGRLANPAPRPATADPELIAGLRPVRFHSDRHGGTWQGATLPLLDRRRDPAVSDIADQDGARAVGAPPVPGGSYFGVLDPSEEPDPDLRALFTASSRDAGDTGKDGLRYDVLLFLMYCLVSLRDGRVGLS